MLDGLRAVAVLTVMFYHFGAARVPGDLGVSGFFVLSGFLITWLLRKEWHDRGDVSLQRFYARRVLRIFPAYYVFLAITFSVVIWRHGQWSPGLIAASVSYLVNYYNALNGHPPTAVAHAWSLAVEEQFYLLWPFLFRLAARRGSRALIGLLTGIILAVVTWRSVLYLGVHVGSAYVYNAFDTRFDMLAIGCLLAVGLERPGLRAAAAVTVRSPLLPVLTVLLLLLSRMATPASYHYSVGFTVDALLIAVLIVQLLQLHALKPWALLDHPAVRYLGVLSYPMYLYHVFGGIAVRRLAMLPGALAVAVGTALTIALAAASYRFVEQPFLRLKRRFAALS